MRYEGPSARNDSTACARLELGMKLCAEEVGQDWLGIVKGPRGLGPNRDIMNDCDTLVGVVAVRTIYRTASMPQKAYLSLCT